VNPVSEDEYRLNTLLARLPAEEFLRLAPRLEPADLRVRDQLYRYREPMSAVYFPLTAVVSMVTHTAGRHAPVEIGTVGFEGMVGLPAFLGVTTSPTAAFCQIPGRVAGLPIARFGEFLTQDGRLHAMLHRYTHTMIAQLSQNVVCNMVHLVEQRAARWLLTCGDRVRSDRFPLTQEFLAQMLGVRRSTVSEVASKLQSDDLITYQRGELEILDRPRLRDTACECYHVIKAEFDGLTD
jgi:CRP-like cAMP-binding protein